MLQTQSTRVLDLLTSRGMLRLKDFIAEDIEPETLSRLVRSAKVIRAARGLYQLPDTPAEAAHMFAEACILIPKGVICLTSALQFHELTLQMPSAIWMAIEHGAWRPAIAYPPVRFARFNTWAMTEGISRHGVENREIPVTNPARTIVDCFRYRNKIGLDVALEGLRSGLRRRQRTPDELWRYAVKARAWNGMRPYVEAIASEAA